MTHRQVADGAPTDLHRGQRVALEQRRRYRQRGCNVVEAIDRNVRRQRCRDGARLVVEQIADRVRVFGAVQARQRLGARVRRPAPGRVEILLEPARRGVQHRAIRALLALRRHEPRAQLAHGGLPDLGVGAEVPMTELLERYAAGKIVVVMAAQAVAVDHLPVRPAFGLGRPVQAAIQNRTRDPGYGQRSNQRRTAWHAIPDERHRRSISDRGHPGDGSVGVEACSRSSCRTYFWSSNRMTVCTPTRSTAVPPSIFGL